MRKPTLLVLATLAVAGMAASLFAFACRRPPVRADLTPVRLCQALREAGLDYEAQPTGPLGAWCLRAPGNTTPWEEIARGMPGHVFAQPGCVRIVPVYAPDGIESGEDARHLRVGPLFLLGHPDDLRRIARALGD